ncbi:MAG TPA: ubiquinol-cytochrome c reductase iron-sulfur subunit N-terminal domain-containing protein [Gemmataceae bacterium]|nr:ubiquinol-cytochrome c reductase iron-sulfur subunit N-terminal domain-containing protein [Gemmataceae bacterium]
MSNSTSQTPSPAEPLPPRRSFLKWWTYGVGAVAAALVAIPFVGYLFGAIRKPQEQSVRLGPLDQFPPNQTRLVTFDNKLGQPWDGMTAHMGVYVRNLGNDRKEQDRFLVFAMNCAHLGCPVTWFPQSGLFMCPCHGGVYYENGERASGPPPRSLFRITPEVRDGELWIHAPFLPTLQNTFEKPARV